MPVWHETRYRSRAISPYGTDATAVAHVACLCEQTQLQFSL